MTVSLFGDEYQERTIEGANGDECAVCGRPAGKSGLLVNADAGPECYGSNMGWHPIGPDCAKKAFASGWQIIR